MADYFISPSGNDGNAGSIGSPRLTIPGGIALLSSGDTLNLRTGTYLGNSIGSYANLFNGRGGTSWSNLTTIQAYQSEVAQIVDPNGFGVSTPSSGQVCAWIQFKNLIIDGGSGAGGGDNGGQTHHIKWDGCEIKNCPQSGLFMGGSSGMDGEYGWAIRCNVHHNGGFVGYAFSDPANDHFDHGIYISSSYNVVEYCDIHDQAHGWGIHNYGGNPNYNIYRYNKIHRNGNETSSTAGVILATGFRNKLHNNLIINNSNGLNIGLGGQDNETLNNTFYGNGLYFAPNNAHPTPVITVDEGLRAVVKNNLSVNNRMNYFQLSSQTQHSNNGFGTV